MTRRTRTYTQTELWMGYGLTAGLIVGVLGQVLTGSPVWIGPSFILGLVIGMAIGQVRDRRSPTGPAPHPTGGRTGSPTRKETP